MADSRISDLTAATTPLAGTELCVLVQSGDTVQATVQDIVDLASGSNLGNANLTADANRTYTLNGSLVTDTLIFKNAAGNDVLTIYGDRRINSSNQSGANTSSVFGYGAGSSSSFQTVTGYNAGASNIGNTQVATGINSGFQNTGDFQTATGGAAGYQNSGAVQTATGYYSGFQNTGGNQTTTGYYAGYQNSGSNQTVAGYYAGAFNTGDNNSNYGYLAGVYLANGITTNTSSSNSLFAGANTKANAASGTNEIVIGYNTTGNGSNTATLGNTNIILTVLRGTVNMANLPTSATGLNSGDVWNDAGTLKIV